MTEQEIFAIAQCLGDGSLSEGEETILMTLCREAKNQWESRLIPGLSPEDCRGAFLTACAWTALAGFQAGGTVSFSAGDLSVQMGEYGDAMQKMAESIMSPYTEDLGFAFLGVEG